jgi:uncharacterized membrane protein YfcA
MTEVQWAVVAVAFLIAGISKGVVGMGLPPIAIGIMSFALPLSDAIAIMVIPTITTNFWQAFYGGHFRAMTKRFWPLGVSAAAGVILTGWVLGKVGTPAAVAWLGVVLVIYATIALLAWRPRTPRSAEGWAGPLIGVSSGAVAGVTGMAAVPFLPYMQSLELTKDELVQALGILFVIITVALAVALAGQGIFGTANVAAGIAANLPVFAGIWLGQKLRRAAQPETFRKVFLISMFAIGLHMARGFL